MLHNITQHHVCVQSLGRCIDGPASIVSKTMRKLPFLEDKLIGVLIEDVHGSQFDVDGHTESMCLLKLSCMLDFSSYE
jgi:hypothetical protein